MLKQAIKKSLAIMGLEIKWISNNQNVNNKERYSVVLPGATYSPWLSDVEFNELYSKIRSSTFIDIYRCYELWTLVDQSLKRKGNLIEIGVWRGGSAALIGYHTKMSEPKRKLYICDTFTGVVKTGPNDTIYKGGEHSDTTKQYVENLIFDSIKLDNVKILEGIFPDETGNLIKNDVFCFCHIDVDVYQSAKDIVEWIWDKLSVGGIIVFDDYGFEGCEGVTKYVDELRLLNDRVIIHNLNGHAILVKLC